MRMTVMSLMRQHLPFPDLAPLMLAITLRPTLTVCLHRERTPSLVARPRVKTRCTRSGDTSPPRLPVWAMFPNLILKLDHPASRILSIATTPRRPTRRSFHPISTWASITLRPLIRDLPPRPPSHRDPIRSR